MFNYYSPGDSNRETRKAEFSSKFVVLTDMKWQYTFSKLFGFKNISKINTMLLVLSFNCCYSFLIEHKKTIMALKDPVMKQLSEL